MEANVFYRMSHWTLLYIKHDVIIKSNLTWLMWALSTDILIVHYSLMFQVFPVSQLTTWSWIKPFVWLGIWRILSSPLSGLKKETNSPPAWFWVKQISPLSDKCHSCVKGLKTLGIVTESKLWCHYLQWRHSFPVWQQREETLPLRQESFSFLTVTQL